jgi:hypothetical protein
MSGFSIEINETVYNLEVETSISENTSTLQIETSFAQTLEINAGYSGNVVFASDILGLDDYLSNFIDDYEIDCGAP